MIVDRISHNCTEPLKTLHGKTESLLTPVLRHLDRCFGNHFVDDPIVARFGHSPLEGHDHVVPGGVWSLGHIGATWIGLGVGVTVDHADYFKTRVLGFSFDDEMLASIDGCLLYTSPSPRD